MHNVKSPPVNLDEYLEGDKKRYLTYEDAARRYSMPYWTFVNLARYNDLALFYIAKLLYEGIDELEEFSDELKNDKLK